MHPVEVALIHWPRDGAERERLAEAMLPRLLLVPDDVEPPVAGDLMEDWIRLPADERDVATRLDNLAARASASTGADRAGGQHLSPARRLDGRPQPAPSDLRRAAAGGRRARRVPGCALPRHLGPRRRSVRASAGRPRLSPPEADRGARPRRRGRPRPGLRPSHPDPRWPRGRSSEGDRSAGPGDDRAHLPRAAGSLVCVRPVGGRCPRRSSTTRRRNRTRPCCTTAPVPARMRPITSMARPAWLSTRPSSPAATPPIELAGGVRSEAFRDTLVHRPSPRGPPR